MDLVLQQLASQVMQAVADKKPVLIRGGNTKAFYGNPVSNDVSRSAVVLDTRAYSGIVSYEPSEMVITARCGTKLSDLQAVLQEQGQMLAWEPPHFGADATLGGTIASGLSGPRRMSTGSARDFVLGTKYLNASGQTLDFGGEVIKNVAGYDVSRLLAGSMGIFGVILDVSIRVLPLPRIEKTLAHGCTRAQAIAFCNQWRGQPLPISASAWEQDISHPERGVMYTRLSGAETAVNRAAGELVGDLIDDGAAALFWRSIREQTHAFFAQDTIWRLALPAAAPALELGPTLEEWGGTQRWVAGPVDGVQIRQTALRLGGHATLFRYPDSSCVPQDGVFQPLAAEVLEITRRLKHALDPARVFNPGRLIYAI